MQVVFVTSNHHKVVEANKVGKEYGIRFNQVHILYPEVRAETVTKVAVEGAKYVCQQIDKPVIVEDSGLFIDSLGGFPGPYSAFVYSKIGCKGILDLLRSLPDRSAKFISAVGYCSRGQVKVFEGEIEGIISTQEKGSKGFGYDPIFKPKGHDKTFAQDMAQKNLVSHRRKAIQSLCRFLQPD